MVCKCKNEDGTLSDGCNGTCKHTDVEKIQYSLSMFIDHVSRINREHICDIDRHVAEFLVESMPIYGNGFKSGFVEGLKFAKENGECDSNY